MHHYSSLLNTHFRLLCPVHGGASRQEYQGADTGRQLFVSLAFIRGGGSAWRTHYVSDMATTPPAEPAAAWIAESLAIVLSVVAVASIVNARVEEVAKVHSAPRESQRTRCVRRYSACVGRNHMHRDTDRYTARTRSLLFRC